MLASVHTEPWPTAEAATIGGNLLDAARNVRLRGCDARAGSDAPLRGNIRLNAAANHWSHGVSLKAALQTSGYREEQSSALHATGEMTALLQALTHQLCAVLTDRNYTDIGIAQHGRDVWIIVGLPFAAPMAADEVRGEWLRRVNAARSQARRCGKASFPAAAPLNFNVLLTRAALLHAQDMLDHSYFAHESLDGSTPAGRVSATGYRYRIVGENIASGPESAVEAVQGWLESPAHCENIMDPRFSETGIAYAVNSSGTPHIYWVQDFAAPR